MVKAGVDACAGLERRDDSLQRAAERAAEWEAELQAAAQEARDRGRYIDRFRRSNPGYGGAAGRSSGAPLRLPPPCAVSVLPAATAAFCLRCHSASGTVCAMLRRQLLPPPQRLRLVLPHCSSMFRLFTRPLCVLPSRSSCQLVTSCRPARQVGASWRLSHPGYCCKGLDAQAAA